MMQFGMNKNKLSFPAKSLLSIALFLAVLFVFLYGISHLTQTNLDAQQENLENAIRNCTMQCYALEGTYPPSLEYMKEHYGLTYDEDIFYVDYTSIGGNLAPDVTILVK